MWYLVTKKQFERLIARVMTLDACMYDLKESVASMRDEIAGLKNNIQNQKDVIDMIVRDMARPKAEQRNSQAVSLSEYHDLIEELIFTNRFAVGEKIQLPGASILKNAEIIQMPQLRLGLNLTLKLEDGSIKSYKHNCLKHFERTR